MNYKYINEDEYSRRFPFCKNSEKKNPKYQIHFCIYAINTQLYIEGMYGSESESTDYLDIPELYNAKYPFLQFVTEKSTEPNPQYSFPQKEYECPNIENENDNDHDDTDPLQIHFEKECFQTVFGMFTDTSKIHLQNISIQSLYKGFIEEGDHLYVLFDMSTFIHELKPLYTWAIIDELVFKQKIYDIPVHQDTIRFFKKNPQLRYIQTIDSYEYPFPFQLYMYKIENNEYKTVIRSSDPNNSYIIPSEHTHLGTAYYFTANPINIPADTCKRFCGFIVKCIYDIVIKEDQLFYEDLPIDKIKFEEKILNASTVYFHENGVQYWGIKNNTHFMEL